MGYLSDTRVRIKLGSINGLSAVATKKYTTEGNQGLFIVTTIRAIPKVLTGVGITLPTISIGWTSSNYADLVSLFLLTKTVVDSNELPTMITNYVSIPASTDLYVKVTTAGTGYTTITFDVYLEGYYENN